MATKFFRKPILLLIALTAMLIGACTRGVTSDASKQGSNLAAVGLTMPSIAEYQTAYGQNCEKINFDKNSDLMKRLGVGTKNNCEILVKLFTTYRLNVKPSSCDAGVTGTVIDNQTSAASGKLNQNIRRKCTYSVQLDLGLEGSYYLSNQGRQTDNLTKDRLEKDPVELALRLYPTEAGLKLGLPAQAMSVNPNAGDVDLRIEAKIGDGGLQPIPTSQPGPSQPFPGGFPGPSTPTPGSQPMPNGNQQGDGFIPPSGWNGDVFKGDPSWNLNQAR